MGEPGEAADYRIEFVTVQHKESATVQQGVFGASAQGHAADPNVALAPVAECLGQPVPQHLVVVARHVGDPRPAAALAQQVLYDAVVVGVPVPGPAQCPHVHDVADEIEILALRRLQEIGRLPGAASPGTEVEIGQEYGTETDCSAWFRPVRVCFRHVVHAEHVGMDFGKRRPTRCEGCKTPNGKPAKATAVPVTLFAPGSRRAAIPARSTPARIERSDDLVAWPAAQDVVERDDPAIRADDEDDVLGAQPPDLRVQEPVERRFLPEEHHVGLHAAQGAAPLRGTSVARVVPRGVTHIPRMTAGRAAHARQRSVQVDHVLAARPLQQVVHVLGQQGG